MPASDALDDYLSRNEPAFTAACELILHSAVPEGSAYGMFWFQIDSMIWDDLPIALVWCDPDHGCDVQYPSPITTISSPAWSPPDGLDVSAIGERIFRWIYRCWQKAGGAASPVPFYCHNYHTLEQFCLRHGRHITDREISTDIEPVA